MSRRFSLAGQLSDSDLDGLQARGYTKTRIDGLDAHDTEKISRRLALGPEAVLRAREEGHAFRRQRLLERDRRVGDEATAMPSRMS